MKTRLRRRWPSLLRPSRQAKSRANPFPRKMSRSCRKVRNPALRRGRNAARPPHCACTPRQLQIKRSRRSNPGPCRKRQTNLLRKPRGAWNPPHNRPHRPHRGPLPQQMRAHLTDQPEPPKPHAVPLMPVPQARTQTPVPPAPVKAPEVRPAQTEPEPAPTAPGAQRAPRADHWPMWQEPAFTTPFPAPEPPAAARQESLRPEPPAPLRTERARPLPPQQAWPAVNPPLSAPDPWPDLPEPIRVRRRDRRELPTGPTPADRWPALDRPEDDDLAADEWESYQRDWQRLVRLRREQQGQLWTEWPF